MSNIDLKHQLSAMSDTPTAPPMLDLLVSDLQGNNASLLELIKQLNSFLIRTVGQDKIVTSASDPADSEKPSGILGSLKDGITREGLLIVELREITAAINELA